MAQQAGQPLVSVIIPVYNVEELIPKCLDSILGQTYGHLEVLVVNDGSPGSINSIVTEYQKVYDNIRLVDLGRNQGLFRARLEGFKAARGDYIISVDGDDSISIDYVRTMVAKATKNLSDIVIPETVIENEDRKFVYNFANDLPFEHLNGDECLEKFFEQRGDNYIWHRVAAPMYSRRVVDYALPFLDSVQEHIIMCEDVLFSTVFWGFARRVDRSPTAHYFYYQHDKSSIRYGGIEQIRKKILNINIVYNAVKLFLKSQGSYPKFEGDLLEWMNLYSLDYHTHIDKQSVGGELKSELKEMIQFGDKRWNKKTHSKFYGVNTDFNDGLDQLKEKIIDPKIEIVSFDIFDTLVTRPFLRPSDLFYLLEDDFKKLDKKFRLQSFHDIRIQSEQAARDEKSNKEDVSLAQIYQIMQKEYFVENSVAKKMLKKELEFEIRYCSPRNTTKELYELARFLGKKIIITSDMYLPIKTLEELLLGCGFDGHHKLYVSSHHGTMKATQNLYRHIAADLNMEPGSIIHIGDNYESDVLAANHAGWHGIHFPKATEVSAQILDRIFNGELPYAVNHLGVSAACAIAVNKFFDNPFRSFQRESNYNCSPYMMGYFALGLSLLGFTQWMIEDTQNKKIKSVVFLGRDGYLPKQVFDILRQRTELSIQSNYLPTSRKASIPLSIFNETNISDIKTFNYRGRITKSILTSLRPYMKKGLSSGIKNIDFAKVNKLHKAFVNTYRPYFNDHTAVMDIGYSGRPEQIFAQLFKVPIETYFIYTSTDEAKRRLGSTVNVYGRLKVAAIREKMISEIAPSCIGYSITGDKVEPVFEKNLAISYYEKNFLVATQKGALDFINDYMAFFHDHLNKMPLGDNNLMLHPLDQATVSPTKFDREMYHGVMHEDGVAVDGNISIYDEYYSNLDEDAQIMSMSNENMRLSAELESHMGIKRSAKLLAGNVKRRILYGKKR